MPPLLQLRRRQQEGDRAQHRLLILELSAVVQEMQQRQQAVTARLQEVSRMGVLQLVCRLAPPPSEGDSRTFKGVPLNHCAVAMPAGCLQVNARYREVALLAALLQEQRGGRAM